MSGIDITGDVNISTARKNIDQSLSQTLDSIEAKTFEATLPHTGVDVVVPLGLSSGVTEALFVFIYAPRKITVRYTTSDGARPGPIEMGIKGVHMITFTPGEGLVGLAFSNPDPVVDVVVEYIVGAKAQATDDDPIFYTDT